MTNCGLKNWVTSNSGATVTLTVGGCAVAAGDTVQVVASGVSNPGTVSTGDHIAITTSSDTASANTNAYAITTAQAVSAPSVALFDRAGSDQRHLHHRLHHLVDGSTGGRRRTITLAAPAGTVFSSNGSYTIEDVATATNSGLENWVTSNSGATVTLTGGCTIAAGASVQVGRPGSQTRQRPRPVTS